MSKTEFDLKEIFKSVWGYNAPPVFFETQNKVEKELFSKSHNFEDYSFNNIPTSRRELNMFGQSFYGTNSNGNEVFLPIVLETSSGKRLMLQNTVSSMSCRKNIVETILIGNAGTVKEEISIDDWDINIKGIIVSNDDGYPDQLVHDLNVFFISGETYKIINARTSLLNVKDSSGNIVGGADLVVFKDLKFPEIKGMKNVQAFECNLVTDIEFKLIIS